MALAMRADGRKGQALRLLRELTRRTPGWIEPRLEYADLLGDGKHLADAAAQLEQLFLAQPDDPRVRAKVEALIARRWMEPQVEALAKAVAAHGGASESAWLSCLYAAVRRGRPSAVRAAADVLEASSCSPGVALLALELLARAGETDRARAWAERLLAPIREKPDAAPLASRLDAFVQSLAAGVERYRGSPNVTVRRAPDARATVVAFTALDMEPLLPRDELWRVLEPLGANLVTLSEPDRLMFLTGLEPLGRTFEQTVAGLRQLTRELVAPRLVFIGNSGGSIAALRYAIELEEVDHVLVTGPVTVLDPSHPVMARPRAKPILDRLAARAPERMENLRGPLQARRPPLPVTVYFAAHHGRDQIHAANIEGIAGVTLCPLPSKMHEIGTRLMKAGSLPPILEALVGGTLDPERARSLARVIPD